MPTNTRPLPQVRLDGSTASRDRTQLIDDFNLHKEGSSDAADGRPFVFLLTTRAGGLGINLATADTIVMYDCDWNPHADMQAYSRAHRHGQKRKVMVYKFVTRGTVEEAMVQRAKGKLLLDQVGRRKRAGSASSLMFMPHIVHRRAVPTRCTPTPHPHPNSLATPTPRTHAHSHLAGVGREHRPEP